MAYRRAQRRAPTRRSGRTYNSRVSRRPVRRVSRRRASAPRAAAPRQLKIVLEVAGQSQVARPGIPQDVEKSTRKAKF